MALCLIFRVFLNIFIMSFSDKTAGNLFSFLNENFNDVGNSLSNTCVNKNLMDAYANFIEEIEDEFKLYRQCRQMEKLIDELARGRKMEKILRSSF